MRNLMRTLSLVMAMALIVGMMVVSASAVSSDFNDSAEITNTEAVDVMTAIGVFEGTDKGAFNPTGARSPAAIRQVKRNAPKVDSFGTLATVSKERLSSTKKGLSWLKPRKPPWCSVSSTRHRRTKPASH